MKHRVMLFLLALLVWGVFSLNIPVDVQVYISLTIFYMALHVLVFPRRASTPWRPACKTLTWFTVSYGLWLGTLHFLSWASTRLFLQQFASEIYFVLLSILILTAVFMFMFAIMLPIAAEMPNVRFADVPKAGFNLIRRHGSLLIHVMQIGVVVVGLAYVSASFIPFIGIGLAAVMMTAWALSIYYWLPKANYRAVVSQTAKPFRMERAALVISILVLTIYLAFAATLHIKSISLGLAGGGTAYMIAWLIERYNVTRKWLIPLFLVMSCYTFAVFAWWVIVSFY